MRNFGLPQNNKKKKIIFIERQIILFFLKESRWNCTHKHIHFLFLNFVEKNYKFVKYIIPALTMLTLFFFLGPIIGNRCAYLCIVITRTAIFFIMSPCFFYIFFFCPKNTVKKNISHTHTYTKQVTKMAFFRWFFFMCVCNEDKSQFLRFMSWFLEYFQALRRIISGTNSKLSGVFFLVVCQKSWLNS